MNCFVRKVQKERLFLVLLFFKKFNRFPGQQRRDVTVLRNTLSIVVDGVAWPWWIVVPLPFEAVPVVKSWSRIIFGSAHMPLADESGFVAGFLKVLREEDRSFGNEALVVDHAMPEGVQACQNGCA